MNRIVDRVARYHNYRNAIGCSFYYYIQAILDGDGVKLLAADGVMPSAETIRDRSYPLTEEICAVTAGSTNPNTEPSLRWILSPQGQAIVGAVGYIPLGEVREGAAVPAERRVTFRK